MQGHKFTDEVRILPLGGYDVVLGVEWLRNTTQPFLLNQLSLSFSRGGKSVSLKGTTDSVELHLIGSKGLQNLFKKR